MFGQEPVGRELRRGDRGGLGAVPRNRPAV